MNDQDPAPPEWLAPGRQVAAITVDDAVCIYTVEHHTATQEARARQAPESER